MTEKNRRKLTIASSGLGAGTAAYFLYRNRDISDPNDLVQQRLIAAYKQGKAGVGFPEGRKLRAAIAKIIYDPGLKYYTKHSDIEKERPLVLFSKTKGNSEGGITINGPKLREEIRHLVKDKHAFQTLPFLKDFFGVPSSLKDELVALGHNKPETLSDAELKKAMMHLHENYKAKHGLGYFYKPDNSHSMIGAYGHSSDLTDDIVRKDINLWDRLTNVSLKKRKDPEVYKTIKSNMDRMIINPDYGTNGKEYRIELLNGKPAVLHRFGLKKGLAIDIDKEFNPVAKANLENFIDSYKKFLTSKGAFSDPKEIPFNGADVFIDNVTNKLHGVELQWNSGFPFHAKEPYHMLTKPYGSTARMVEYMSGKPWHAKGLAVGAGAALATMGILNAILKSKDNSGK